MIEQMAFLYGLCLALGSKRFITVYEHTVLPLKESNPDKYRKYLITLVIKYADDFFESLNLKEDDFEKVIIPDNWNIDNIKKLLDKEKDISFEVQ